MELSVLQECGLQFSELAFGAHNPAELGLCWRATTKRSAVQRRSLTCAALRDVARSSDPRRCCRVADVWRAGLGFEPDSPSWLQVWSPDLDLRRLEREICERVPRTALANLHWDVRAGDRLVPHTAAVAAAAEQGFGVRGTVRQLLRVAREESAARFAAATGDPRWRGATRALATRMAPLEKRALLRLAARDTTSSIDPDTVVEAFATTGHLLLSRALRSTKVAECWYAHPLRGERVRVELHGRTQGALLQTLDCATVLSWRSVLLPAAAGSAVDDGALFSAARGVLGTTARATAPA